ncbi:MAG: hypothetical protein FGM14_12645 [Flavobacteriales bacterium]|nr:hypothetical protein [Flavobacteriales bacterium]
MENKETPFEFLKSQIVNSVREKCNSKKQVFEFYDAFKLRNESKFCSNREKNILESIDYLQKNPLQKNDYFKFVNAYFTTGKKLNEKYFRHDVIKLKSYYSKIEDAKKKGIKHNPFNRDNYESYVLFMTLKLKGGFEDSDNDLFKVEFKDNREYNPLSKIPSVLRGCLPFQVKEYDIKRAFPSFIDIELKTDFRHTIYDNISKSNFAMFLNSNCESKVTIETARKGLEPIYKDLTEQVITNVRFNEKGRAFKDFTKYEDEYIQKFVDANKLENYARLHDGIFVLQSVECENLKFDKVEFSIKESIAPKIESEIRSFYEMDENNEVTTCPTLYADFLKQENFIRISTADDKIQLLKNTNNVVDFYNHKTDIVSFLESEINEIDTGADAVRNKIARDNNNVLQQSFTLLEPNPLIYYKDTKTSFGLPFKNGFFYFDEVEKFEIKSKNYSEVNGFFAPHPIQKRAFEYTNEKGDFELFIQRISTGVKNYSDTTDEDKRTINAFHSMVGYLCHNFKNRDTTQAIILTDEGANDETRNGRRGKSLIGDAVKQVAKVLQKAGDEFRGEYIHNYADLDKSYNCYFIDDVLAGFNYNHLYTPITQGISVQPKGKNAVQIEFEDSPKFLITSNWLVRYNEEDASTNARFTEFKVKPYYNINHRPKNEFGKLFFDEWDEMEWNKFYSFIFRCVQLYLKQGLIKIKYDKTLDNYNASFGNDLTRDEMARIIDEIINVERLTAFSVSDFLKIYQKFDNPLKFDKLFHKNNTKNLIDIHLRSIPLNPFIYNTKHRKWMKD